MEEEERQRVLDSLEEGEAVLIGKHRFVGWTALADDPRAIDVISHHLSARPRIARASDHVWAASMVSTALLTTDPDEQCGHWHEGEVLGVGAKLAQQLESHKMKGVVVFVFYWVHPAQRRLLSHAMLTQGVMRAFKAAIASRIPRPPLFLTEAPSPAPSEKTMNRLQNTALRRHPVPFLSIKPFRPVTGNEENKWLPRVTARIDNSSDFRRVAGEHSLPERKEAAPHKAQFFAHLFLSPEEELARSAQLAPRPPRRAPLPIKALLRQTLEAFDEQLDIVCDLICDELGEEQREKEKLLLNVGEEDHFIRRLLHLCLAVLFGWNRRNGRCQRWVLDFLGELSRTKEASFSHMATRKYFQSHFTKDRKTRGSPRAPAAAAAAAAAEDDVSLLQAMRNVELYQISERQKQQVKDILANFGVSVGAIREINTFYFLVSSWVTLCISFDIPTRTRRFITSS